MIRIFRLAAACIVLFLLQTVPANAVKGDVTLHYFWGEGCSHCARAKPFVADLAKRYPRLQVHDYEVFHNQENLDLLLRMAEERGGKATGVPTFIVGERMFSGFSPETAGELKEWVELSIIREGGSGAASLSGPADILTIPFIGRVDTTSLSLPFFTIVIAALDSFNPCAFFVLLFLLSLLIHAHSRSRIMLIGGIFVFFSGFVYFLFMAAWLNLFMLVGHLPAITIAAGILAIVVAAINIKDFFFFEQGVSLVIPKRAKPRLFEQMREIMRAGRLPAMIGSTIVLSAAANSYELLCTAGFPMVFTRVLTLHQLPTTAYYLYLVFYNLVYVVPLAIIVAIFTVTLGSRKLSEWQGRLLKLVSGSMMLCLGGVLLVRPALLSNALLSFVILAVALLGAWLTVAVSRRLNPERFSDSSRS